MEVVRKYPEGGCVQGGGLITLPPHYTKWDGEDVSNFTNPPRIPEGLNKALKTASVYVQHSAWDHCGYIFCLDDGKFYEEVSVYKEHVGTEVADTLEQLVVVVNDKYGWE